MGSGLPVINGTQDDKGIHPGLRALVILRIEPALLLVDIDLPNPSDTPQWILFVTEGSRILSVHPMEGVGVGAWQRSGLVPAKRFNTVFCRNPSVISTL